MKEFEFYHGAAITRLMHSVASQITISIFPSNSNASYILNSNIGIYIKHSAKRLPPWSFSFHEQHQNEILEMHSQFDNVFILLVCWQDGIVTLSFEELKYILDHEHKDNEWVRVYRRPKQKYTVTGSDGKLKYKIGNSEFPKKILVT